MNSVVKTDEKLDDFVEIKLDKAINNFLERYGYENYSGELDIINSTEISFVKISHIVYDRKRDETDINLVDFEQILSSLASKNGKFIYLLESDESGVSLYLGTLKDSVKFLDDTVNGIYSGSKTEIYEDPNFSNMKMKKAMLGIPSLKRDSDKSYKQSLEKILFPMQGKKFRIVLTADSYDRDEIKEIISNYQTLGNDLHKLSKLSKNANQSSSDTTGVTFTAGSSESFGKTDSQSESKTKGFSYETTGSKVVSFVSSVLFGSSMTSFNESTTTSTSTSTSHTKTTNESRSDNTSSTTSKGFGITYEEINKSVLYAEELVDKFIERFQKGLSYGMWNVAFYIEADDDITLNELEHTLKSVYSGDETHYEAIRFSPKLYKDEIIPTKFPIISFKNAFDPISKKFASFSSTLNSNELSILSALPNNDIDGISVAKISSFGLTQSKELDKFNSIGIGHVLNRKKPTNQRFRVGFDSLNSHLFVSGATGSGKSNSIKGILKSLNEFKIPFLVIEPAKSEYKNLLSEIPDMQIFRPGVKNDVFKFNPFIFEYSKDSSSITLTKHIDMLKTTFISAFGMYGPMPYVLEDAIYKVYEDRGWNLDSETHPYFTDLSGADEDRRSLFFPNMNDLKNKIDDIVDRSGYYTEANNNIKAALKTRIGI